MSSTLGVKDKKTDSSVSKDKSKSVKKLPAKVVKPSADSKLEAMDQKWFECFSRLEDMHLSRSFNHLEPVFQLVVVSPTMPPPAGAGNKSDNRPSTTDQAHTGQVIKFVLSTSTVNVQQTPESDMDTSSDSDSAVHELPTGQAEEGKLLDLDQDVCVTGTD